MPVGPKGGDAAAALAERLQSLEYSLGVVEDRCARVERERRVGNQRGAVPTAVGGPGDPDHVLGEDAAETGVREEPLAFCGGRPDLGPVDLKCRGGRPPHAPPTVRPTDLSRLDLLQPRPTLPLCRQARPCYQGILRLPKGSRREIRRRLPLEELQPASAGEHRAVRGTAAFRDFGGWTCSSRDLRFLPAAGRLSAAQGYFPFRRGLATRIRRAISRLGLPGSARATECRDVGGTRQGSHCDIMRPSLAARPRER